MHKTVKTNPALLWLIAVWSIGASLGFMVASGNADALAASLRMSENMDGSVLVLSAIVPIFAVYLFSQFHLHGLIFPVMFLKSVTDSILLIGICAAFGSAAWLAGALLLFSDKIATVLLLYFAGKCLSEPKYSQTARFVSFVLAIAAVIAVDRFCISPYFMNLML